jgi:hypothetical protein
MSVRYTATWYDVMQAHRHTSIAVCRPRIAGRAAGFLAVPARPAGLQLSVLSHTLTLSSHAVLQRQAAGTVYAGVIGSKWRSSVL